MSFRDGQSLKISVGAAVDTIQSGYVPKGDAGMLVEVKLIIPTVSETVTFTFSILDQDGDTRYSISSIAKNTKPILMPNRIIKRGYKFGITPSAVTGTAIDVDIYPTYEV